MNANRAAFLDMIGVSEGTSTNRITRNHGYDVIVSGISGPEVFTDYSDHPFMRRAPKAVNSTGLCSTASGKFQIMIHDWPHYRAQLGLPDFSPASQELMAVQLIRERGALPLIDGGSFDLAVARCANLWASFTGATYGQATHQIGFLRDAYLSAGGKLTGSAPMPDVLPIWGNEARR